MFFELILKERNLDNEVTLFWCRDVGGQIKYGTSKVDAVESACMWEDWADDLMMTEVSDKKFLRNAKKHGFKAKKVVFRIQEISTPRSIL